MYIVIYIERQYKYRSFFVFSPYIAPKRAKHDGFMIHPSLFQTSPQKKQPSDLLRMRFCVGDDYSLEDSAQENFLIFTRNLSEVHFPQLEDIACLLCCITL